MTPHAMVLASVLLHVQPWSGNVVKACREIAVVTGGDVHCSRWQGYPVRFEPDPALSTMFLALAFDGPYECQILHQPDAKLTAHVIAHEIAHCIGFRDSNDPRDLMWPHEKRLRWPWSRARFNERERMAWRALKETK